MTGIVVRISVEGVDEHRPLLALEVLSKTTCHDRCVEAASDVVRTGRFVVEDFEYFGDHGEGIFGAIRMTSV